MPSSTLDAIQLAPQLSLKSEPESERILAVGGIKQPNRDIPRIRDPPDLDPEEQEIRIRHQLETIRNKLRALLQVCASGTSAQPFPRRQLRLRSILWLPYASDLVPRRSEDWSKCTSLSDK